MHISSTLKKPRLLVSVFTILSMLALGYGFINNGHFHEDAYILFIYVENLVNGNGITFYPDAEPIEGATDFLWLVILSALGFLGLNTGLSVIVINAISAGAIVFLLTSAWSSSNNHLNNKTTVISYCLTLVLAVLALLQEPTVAALGGFSVLPYMALILFAIHCLDRADKLNFVPYISIIIALFRPDGVILGVIFTLIGLAKAFHASQVKSYLKPMVIAGSIGIAYFFWRWWYFGNLLPLPLYVKSHTPVPMPGKIPNTLWLNLHAPLIIASLILATLNRKLIKSLILLLGPASLFTILYFALQSQNIGFRFQAPLLIALFYIAISNLIDLLDKNQAATTKSRQWLFFQIALTTFSLVAAAYLLPTASNNLEKASKQIITDNYINIAPSKIAKILPLQATIVLTEAGRLPYWVQKPGVEIIDAVGLNHSFIAQNPLTLEFLNEKDPDLIMLHHANNLAINNPESLNQPVHTVSGELANITKIKVHKNLVKKNKVLAAGNLLLQFIERNQDQYDILLVDYVNNRKFQHVYAIKKRLDITSALKEAIETSFKKENQSYFDIVREKQ